MVGDYYGAANELAMMQELRARGPFPVDLRVPPGFSQYSEGIFSEDHLNFNQGKLSDPNFVHQQQSTAATSKWTLNALGIEWYYVNHSVLLIGWGQDDETGMKYWICRNSYGPDYGERGNFRIRRGLNDCGVESNPSAYSIKRI